MQNQEPNPFVVQTEDTIDENSRPKKKTFWDRLNFSRPFLIILIVAVAAIVLSVLWVVLRQSQNHGQPKVNVWFDLGQKIISGSASEFSLLYENQGSEDLESSSLEVVYPDGFRFLESRPESADGNGRSFNIGRLPAGKSGSVKINGIFSGSPQEVKTLRAKLYFHFAGASANYTSGGEASVSLEAPDLNLRIFTPAQNVIGQRLDYNIGFQNVSGEELNRVQVRVSYPEGFVFVQSDRKPAADKIWDIGHLAVGEESSLKISGILNGEPDQEKVLQVDLGYVGDGGNFVLQNRTYATTSLLPSPLTASLRSPTPRVLSEGESVSFFVDFANRGEQGMNNVKIFVNLEGEAVDLPSLKIKNGALVGRKVLWNASGVSGLLVLQPQQAGTVDFSVNFKKNLSNSGIKNPSLTAKVYVSSDEMPEPVLGNSIEFKARTRLTLNPGFEYVSGVWPLQAEKETVLRIKLLADNTTNDVSGAVAEATLNVPAADVIDTSLPAGMFGKDFKYNKGSGRILWNIGDIPSFGSKEVDFLITVTPSIVDDLKNLSLLKDIRASGLDVFTSETVADESHKGRDLKVQ